MDKESIYMVARCGKKSMRDVAIVHSNGKLSVWKELVTYQVSDHRPVLVRKEVVGCLDCCLPNLEVALEIGDA